MSAAADRLALRERILFLVEGNLPARLGRFTPKGADRYEALAMDLDTLLAKALPDAPTEPGNLDTVLAQALPELPALSPSPPVEMPITLTNGSESRHMVLQAAPEALQMMVAGARRGLDDYRAEVAATLGESPVAPEACMTRAHLESGYLDVWFATYTRWIVKARERLIGRSQG